MWHAVLLVLVCFRNRQYLAHISMRRVATSCVLALAGRLSTGGYCDSFFYFRSVVAGVCFVYDFILLSINRCIRQVIHRTHANLTSTMLIQSRGHGRNSRSPREYQVYWHYALLPTIHEILFSHSVTLMNEYSTCIGYIGHHTNAHCGTCLSTVECGPTVAIRSICNKVAIIDRCHSPEESVTLYSEQRRIHATFGWRRSTISTTFLLEAHYEIGDIFQRTAVLFCC